MKNYSEKSDEILIEMVKQKEEADKRLLKLEVVIGVISIAFLFAMIVVAALFQMPTWTRILLIVIGFIQFLIAMAFGLRIEQVAGYYECAKCGHRYVPKYAAVHLAMHMGRTRYMKCPKCGKWSWQKKVISKEANAGA